MVKNGINSVASVYAAKAKAIKVRLLPKLNEDLTDLK
jgi:hypothetical protein